MSKHFRPWRIDEAHAKAQRNFTGPQSGTLKTKDGFIQGYNAQAAMDGTAQIVVEDGPTLGTSDQDQLIALVDGAICTATTSSSSQTPPERAAVPKYPVRQAIRTGS